MERKGVTNPMSMWLSLLFFGIPTVLFTLSIYVGMPYLGFRGVNPIVNYTVTLMGPVILLFFASFAAFKLEGHPMNWKTVRKRFRLNTLNKKEWGWVLGLSLFMLLGNVIFMPTQNWLLSNVSLAIPDFLPSTLDPRITVSGLPPEFASETMASIILFQLFFMFFNIFGEELWWRGYILPRQELAHGKHTWLIHGLLWTLFHSFWWWNLLVLLPGALAAAFVAQKLKNTTILILAHLLVNSLGGVIVMLING